MVFSPSLLIFRNFRRTGVVVVVVAIYVVCACHIECHLAGDNVVVDSAAAVVVVVVVDEQLVKTSWLLKKKKKKKPGEVSMTVFE